jgi:hypothetical protein
MWVTFLARYPSWANSLTFSIFPANWARGGRRGRGCHGSRKEVELVRRAVAAAASDEGNANWIWFDHVMFWEWAMMLLLSVEQMDLLYDAEKTKNRIYIYPLQSQFRWYQIRTDSRITCVYKLTLISSKPSNFLLEMSSKIKLPTHAATLILSSHLFWQMPRKLFFGSTHNVV